MPDGGPGSRTLLQDPKLSFRRGHPVPAWVRGQLKHPPQHRTYHPPPHPPPPLTITLSPVAIHHLRNKTFYRTAAVQFPTSPSLLAGDPVSWLVTSCPFCPGCPVLTWMSAEKPSTIPNPLTDDYHSVLNTPNSSRYVNWSIQHDIYTPSSEAALLTLKSSSLLAMTSTESDHNTYPPTNDCLSDVDI